MTTEEYYNENAEIFVENTFHVNVLEFIDTFTKNLPKGGKILDVGCGSGRNTLTFKQLGFEVIAFDASKELVKLASSKINHKILHMKIEDMNWQEEFDGIWAMASLLHFKREEMEYNVQKILTALKPGGTFFLSLKEGKNEGFDEKGRFFTYYSKEEIQELFKKLGYENIKVIESKKDSLQRDVRWISAIITKDLKLVNKLKI